jgi:hypothetical protein
MQLSRIFSVAAAITILAGPAAAQQTLDTLPVLVERNMSGPRFGLTYVWIKEELREFLPPGEFHSVISQFGWHFEHQITPDGGGPQFLIQFVPMVAGVEHGMFIPNMTLALGIRLPGGFESGIGPNIQLPKNLDFDRGGEVTSALVVAVGKTFHYGGVNIPFDIVYAFNPNGNRLSFILGYAIQRTRSRRVGRR